ncbi:MAG: DUF2752 domain-containing protein, partial [Bacteroidales bacterium]
PLKYFALWLWQKKEALIWIVALIFLAFSNPAVHHYTLCPLDNLGISYCPGCGLGRSIGYFFRLDIESSFLAHPLGIPAVFLLVYRSLKILIKPSALNLSTT